MIRAIVHTTYNTKIEFVLRFFFQNLINKQWIGLQGQDKMEIRSTLTQYLMAHHTTVPSFIRNKLVKLVVDIGRLDWPHFYPDFFTSILQVINSYSYLSIVRLLLCQSSYLFKATVLTSSEGLSDSSSYSSMLP